MKFQEFVNKAFWLLLLGVISLGVSHISDISKSVASLNEKMIVVVEKVNGHESRIKVLEAK